MLLRLLTSHSYENRKFFLEIPEVFPEIFSYLKSLQGSEPSTRPARQQNSRSRKGYGPDDCKEILTLNIKSIKIIQGNGKNIKN